VSKARGFSTRLMWRANGKMVTYAYYPDKPKSIRCGEDWNWDQGLSSGKWHEIKMWCKLNSPGDKNGEFKAWLDGKQVLHKKGIRYRYTAKYKISRTYITTYVGGSTVSQFAPKKNQYIWFKDFETWSGGGDSQCGLSKSSGSSGSSSPRSSSSRSSSSGSSASDDGLKGVGTKRAPTGAESSIKE
jgi:hypothetical protein